MILGNHIEVTNKYVSTIPRRSGSFPYKNFVRKGKNVVPKYEDITTICLRTATLKQPDHSDVIIARIRMYRKCSF
jgi:hypothetical protein